MRNNLFVLFILAVLFFSSCSKNSSSAGSWAFEGVSYSAAGASYSIVNNTLTATSGSNSDPGTLVFYFPALPARNASYRVVNYTSLPLDSDQMYIQFINGISSFYYYSTGTDNVNANVSVSGGKVSVSLPAVLVKSYSSATSDSAKLTAVINQQ